MNWKWIIPLIFFNLNIYNCVDDKKKLSNTLFYFYLSLIPFIILIMSELTIPTGGIGTTTYRFFYKIYNRLIQKINNYPKPKYNFKTVGYALGPIQKAAIIRALIVTFSIFVILWLLSYISGE